MDNCASSGRLFRLEGAIRRHFSTAKDLDQALKRAVRKADLLPRAVGRRTAFSVNKPQLDYQALGWAILGLERVGVVPYASRVVDMLVSCFSLRVAVQEVVDLFRSMKYEPYEQLRKGKIELVLSIQRGSSLAEEEVLQGPLPGSHKIDERIEGTYAKALEWWVTQIESHSFRELYHFVEKRSAPTVSLPVAQQLLRCVMHEVKVLEFKELCRIYF